MSMFELSDPPSQINIEASFMGEFVIYRRSPTQEPEIALNWKELEPLARDYVESLGQAENVGVQVPCPNELAAKARWASGTVGVS